MLKVEHTINISKVSEVGTDNLIAEFFGPDKVQNALQYVHFKNHPHPTEHYRTTPISGGEVYEPFRPSDQPVSDETDSSGLAAAVVNEIDQLLDVTTQGPADDSFDAFQGGTSGGGGAAASWEDASQQAAMDPGEQTSDPGDPGSSYDTSSSQDAGGDFGGSGDNS